MRVGENIWQLFLPDEAFICSELKVLIIATSYTNSEWGNEDKFIKIYLKKNRENQNGDGVTLYIWFGSGYLHTESAGSCKQV